MADQDADIALVKRTPPDRLRYLAEKLDAEGENETIRYAVTSALLLLAIEMEVEHRRVLAHWAGHSDGSGANDG